MTADSLNHAQQQDYDTPTNLLKPASDSTLTIRVIKSFVYRATKPLVLHHVNLEECTVAGLKALVAVEITKPAWKAYRNVTLDTLKIYTVAHGHKTTNLIINLETDPSLYLTDEDSKLISYKLENETELSYFNSADYESYIANPETKW